MFGLDSLVNGGIGLVGSVVASVAKSVTDLKMKDKELEQKRLEYEMAKSDNEHQKEMHALNLQSTKELNQLQSIENEKQRAFDSSIAATNADLEVFKANAEVDKVRFNTTYLPENAKWVDYLSAFVRPYIAMVLSTIFVVVFGYYMFSAVSQMTQDITKFEALVKTDFVMYGLQFIENIIMYYFGSRTLSKKR